MRTEAGSFGRAGWSALVLFLAIGLGGSPAIARGVRPELGFAASGMLNLGDLGTVSQFSVGWDVALRLVRESGGLGLRAAGGRQALQGHELPTDWLEFSYGAPFATQYAMFEASQNYWWLAVGPAYSRPLARALNRTQRGRERRLLERPAGDRRGCGHARTPERRGADRRRLRPIGRSLPGPPLGAVTSVETGRDRVARAFFA